MTVYVDLLPSKGWGRWNSGAHMLGNDLEELHQMALSIGLRRDWFQDKTTFAHYDLTASKRSLALVNGAVPIELGEIPEDVLVRCSDGSYEHSSVRRARRLKQEISGPQVPLLDGFSSGKHEA